MDNKKYTEKIELSPDDWLNWSDEKFNDWRRKHDFPRIVEFLYKNFPYFPLWLSEQKGLTEADLIFHGPARFIKYYGQPVTYIEHDISFNPFKKYPTKKILSYNFLQDKHAIPKHKKEIRKVKFKSYLDWAFLNKNWVFEKKINDLYELVCNLTPSRRTSGTSDSLNSNSSISFNIRMFMTDIPIEQIHTLTTIEPAPILELLKLGGNNKKIVDGLIGEKNLEFTNIDNITLISPIITSYQKFIFCTLRNFNICNGGIHAATFHQCAVKIRINNGSLANSNFEYCESNIELNNSHLIEVSIKEARLNLKLKDTKVTNCYLEYRDLFKFSAKAKNRFHNSAKMIFSHLKYPDLAGEHFLIEKKSERQELRRQLTNINKKQGIKSRCLSLFNYTWMSLQELYWGYGERPLHIILFSLSIVIALSLFCLFHPSSSTFHDFESSFIFSFQSLTNIPIIEIKQQYQAINLIASFMSFFGLMSMGLLVAGLAAKANNYN